MWIRWLVALLIGFTLLAGQIAPAFAGAEGGDPPDRGKHKGTPPDAPGEIHSGHSWP